MAISVICAIVKNEQRFIREWVEHYLRIGFNKLYIYEDYGSDSHKKQLADLIEDGRVHLESLELTGFVPNNTGVCAVQNPLYCKFFDMCKNGEIDAEWVGFFDVDEFLVFEDGWDLERLELEFCDKGGVLLSWLMFGANGHIERPNGGVVENYTSHLPKNTYVDGTPQWNHKSLVNIKKSSRLITIHTFEGCVHTDGNGDYINSPQTYEKAWLNHYFTKSWEDYCNRMFNRGNMRNNNRCFDYFFYLSPEFASRKKEMLESVRHMKTLGTMWISRKYRIISGGNHSRLELLRKYYVE